MKCHPEIYVGHLRPYKSNRREVQPPRTVMIDDNEEYVVDTITSHEIWKTGRQRTGKMYNTVQ